jgi:hypothetical protein
MRFELFVGGILAAGLVMTAAACGSSEASGTNPDDGSGGETNGSSSGGSSGASSSGASSSGETSSSSGGSSSGSTSSGGLTAKELATGFVTITGIAGDQVVYQAVDTGGVTLNAVPIGGGTPTKISDMVQGDRAFVSGGAVGVWRTVTNGIGTFNVWTKAAGLKAGPANSLVGLWRAADDGSRIAVSVAATATSSRIAVLDPAALTADTTYETSGAFGAINIADTCPPFFRFAGKTFVAAYCTSGSAVRARLVKAPDGDPALTSVVSNASNASGIQPYFQLNKDNTKVMVLGLPNTESGVTQDEQLRIVTLADDAVQIIDTDVFDGVLNADGSAVIYETGTGALKRASTGASPSPVEILPAGTIKSVEAYSSDRARLLFDSSDPDPDTGAVDLKTATTAAAVAAADVATGVQPIGFNGAETHFVFVKEGATSATLIGKPVAGGADKDLFTDPEIVLVQPTAGGVLVGHDSKETMLGSQKIPVFSLTTVDMAATKKLVASDVPEGEWAFKDKTLVYSRLVVSGTAIGTGTGLFAVTLP